jgi:hypothetical protein
MKSTIHTFAWASLKKKKTQKTTNNSQEHGEIMQPLWKTIKQFLKKFQNRISIGFFISTCEYSPRRTESRFNMIFVQVRSQQYYSQ